MLTTGTVTMSLSDVDALRNEIKEGQKKIVELNGLIKDLEADKRVIQVTKYKVDRRKPVISSISVDLQYAVEKFLAGTRYGYIGSSEVEGFINHSISFYNPAQVIDPTQEKAYINFEDVKQELKKEVEQQVYEELAELKRVRESHIKKIADLKVKYQDELQEKENEYVQEQIKANKEFATKEKDYLEKIHQLEKEYTDLKEDKDTRKTEQKLRDEIKELKQQVEAFSKKTFIQRVFNL